ncbi:MAG: glycosyltransferase family 39 protein [Actinobacteria bacterium]|nr:glycosyltransferase family 39 protein [Actinomycetota bacterium]
MFETARGPRREILALVLIFLSFFFLYNYLNLSRGRWTLHPDDKRVYVFSNVLLETGHLWYQSPLNQEFETDAFVPGMDDYVSEAGEGERIRAPYSPGIFFLVCTGNLFGYRGPFFIISFVALMGLFFFYLTVRKLYGIKTALLSAVFLGFSSAYVYWSNMLFSNIPALSFSLGGIYFVVMAVSEPDRLRYYLLAAAFFAASIWIRYEFVILAVLAMLPALRSWRKLRLKYVIYAVVLLGALGGLILILNNATTGSLFGIPEKAGETASEYMVKYPARFRGFGVLFNNGDMYLYSIAPLLTVLGVLGLVYAAKNERSVYVLLFALIGVLVFYYYGNNSQFWGYGRYWMASSYTRYFLPLFAALSLFAGLFVARFLGRLNWRRYTLTLVTVLVIATHIITSLYLLHNVEFGLSYTHDYMESRKAVDDFVGSLPEETIVVDLADSWFEKMIISRTVFVPANITEEEREDKAAEILTDLLESGVEIYVLSSPDRGILTVKDLEALSGDFALTPVSHEIEFTRGGRSPDIYRLEWKTADETDAGNGTMAPSVLPFYGAGT